jgi:type I restriction enzyme, S subunit
VSIVPDLNTITIEEATDRLIDYRGKTPPKTDSGVRLITAKVVKGGQILEEPKEFIASDFYDEWMRRGLPQKLDVLLTTEAPLGEVAVLRDSERIALAQRIILLRAKPGHVDPLFLFYALQSDFGQGELRARASGTTVLGIKQSELRKVHIPFFPLPVQRRIAGILSAYDELMENSQRRIRLLEAMARALYREWFVHFRFPGHEKLPRVDSPLGDIPQGWEVKKLKDTCRLTMGQSPKSEFYNERGEGQPFHQGVTDFGDRFPTDRLFCTAEGRIAEAGDILFSVRAPVGRMNIADKKVIIGRGLSAIRHNDGHQAFLWEQLRNRFTEEDMMGNGAIFAAVTKQDMEGIEILCPPQPFVASAEKQFGPIHDEIGSLTRQIHNLRRTRDLLLPRLLLGQVVLEVAE